MMTLATERLFTNSCIKVSIDSFPASQNRLRRIVRVQFLLIWIVARRARSG
jgi:hypothetical protein